MTFPAPRRPSPRVRRPGRLGAAVALGLVLGVAPALGGVLATAGFGWAPGGPAAAAPAPVGQAAPAGGEQPGDTTDDTLTWSVRPTPTAEAPERPNYAYDLDPGATVRDSIRIRNYGAEPLPLTIYASDAVTTGSGALDLLPAGQEPTDVGSWIVLDTVQVEVPPAEFVDVPFTMVVPAGTESGDHSGGIVTSYRAPGTDDGGQPVVLDRRLGSRVHVRVGGELQPRLEVSGLEVRWSGSASPAGTGTLHVSYEVANTGNVRLAAEQRVAVPGRLGLPGREVTLDPMPELLPGGTLRYAVDVADVWPTFRTTAEVTLTPVAVRPGDDFGDDPPTGRAATTTWAVPWSTLALAVAVIGVPLLWRRSRERRRRREAALVQQATQTAAVVQEAVRAALAAQSAGSPGPDGTDPPEPAVAAVDEPEPEPDADAIDPVEPEPVEPDPDEPDEQPDRGPRPGAAELEVPS